MTPRSPGGNDHTVKHWQQQDLALDIDGLFKPTEVTQNLHSLKRRYHEQTTTALSLGMHLATPRSHGGICLLNCFCAPSNLVVPRKICFKRIIKKIFPRIMYFCSPNLKTWLRVCLELKTVKSLKAVEKHRETVDHYLQDVNAKPCYFEIKLKRKPLICLLVTRRWNEHCKGCVETTVYDFQ